MYSKCLEYITDTTIINKLKKSKNLITIVDLLGKYGIIDSKYSLLLYIYDDGSIEKKYILK
tara:strand:- start:268 stop:450 length:183 start_codon:yes stop_codon:yes gene_type:complete